MEFSEFSRYLDEQLKELKEDIKGSIDDKINPIKEDIIRLRGNSEQHYEEVKEMRKELSAHIIEQTKELGEYKESQSQRIGDVEGRVKTLEDDKTDNKDSAALAQAKKANKITIIIFIVAFVVREFLPSLSDILAGAGG